MPDSRRDDGLRQPALAVVLIVLAVVTVGYIWWSVRQFEDYVQCQAEWGDQMVAAQIASDASALQDRQLDRREIRSVIELIQSLDDGMDSDEALATWRDSIAEIDRQRADITADREDGPSPSPPTQVCGRR